MKKFETLLDLLTFEIRYLYGNLFWDRCGQTLLDIETQCDGWFHARDERNVGRLEKPEKDMYLVFNDSTFNFSQKNPSELNNDSFIEEVEKVWRIIKANFGLEEYNRIGYRLHFLKPTKSTDQSEKLIQRSELNIKIPDQIKNANYNLKIRHLVSIFDKDDMEYRVELRGITRSQAIDPTNLYSGRPEALSKNQKEFRIQKLKRMREYSTNPMYAVMLDIDCVNYDPEHLVIGEFIKKQIKIVKTDFLPILEGL